MTYQYRCGCGDQEFDFPMGEAPSRVGVCPDCEADIRRVFTPPAIVYGPGMRPYWANKVQKSREGQERFGRS